MNKKAYNKAIGETEKIYNKLAEIAGLICERGWAERNAGNISVNVTSLPGNISQEQGKLHSRSLPGSYPGLAGKKFLVTASGSRMRDIARDPFSNILEVLIDSTGISYSYYCDLPLSLRPTSEFPTHLGIHNMIMQRGSDEKVVLHTHATELIALTQIKDYCNQERINSLLMGMHPETIIFVPKQLGFVPYTTPGTKEIASRTLEVLKDHDVALWEKHGIFSIGDNPDNTFDAIDILAKSARIFFMCRQAGFTPEGLDKSELDILKKIVF